MRLLYFCEHVLKLTYGIYKYLLLAQKKYYFFHKKRKTLQINPIYVTRIEWRAFSNYTFTNVLFWIFMSILCQFIVHTISIFLSSCPSCSESLGRKLRTEICNTTYKWECKKCEGTKYHLECDTRETWRSREYFMFIEDIPSCLNLRAKQIVTICRQTQQKCITFQFIYY
jgi:hypothetical protein